MKKLLSIILACAMVMSLFCVVPASATEYGIALGAFDVPYFYASMEDNKIMFNQPTGITAVVTDEYAHTGSKSIKLTYASRLYDGSNLSTALYGKLNGTTTKLSYAAEAGDKITLNFYVKLAQELSTNYANATVIVWYSGTRQQHSFKLDADNLDWQEVNLEIVMAASGNITGFEFRMGDLSTTNLAPSDLKDGARPAATDTISQRVYYIDDFEFKIEREKGIAEAYSDTASYMVGDSEDFSGISYSASVASEASIQTYAEGDTKASDDEANTKFYRIDRKNDASNTYVAIKLKDKLKTGHTYLFRYSQRVTGIAPTTTNYSYINNQFQYKDDESVQDSNWDATHGSSFMYTDQRNNAACSISEAFLDMDLNNDGDKEDTLNKVDETVCNIDINGDGQLKAGMTAFNELTLDIDVNKDGDKADKSVTFYADPACFGTWKTYTVTFGTSTLGTKRVNTSTAREIYDYAGVAEYMSTDNYLYILPTVAYSYAIDAVYDFDNFEVIDMGILSNGTVDSKWNGPIYNGNRTVSTAMTEYKADFAGWYVSGKNDVDYQIKRQTGSAHTSASKAQLTWYQYTENGKLWQPVPMKANQQYKLTFWIRNASGALQNKDYTYSVRAKFDRSGAETLSDKAVYDTAGADGDYIEYGEWMQLPQNGVYKKYEMIVDNSFPTLAGKKVTAGILPEIAIMSLEFSSTDETVFSAEKVGGNLIVYIDDFSLEAIENVDVPAVTEASASAEGGIVTPAYTFETVGNTATDKSVYNIVKDGIVYASYAHGNAITIPEGLEGASLQIVPVSSTGYLGTPVTVAIDVLDPEPEPEPEPEPDPIVGITLIPSLGGITIETDTALTDAKLIFVTYDANGKMVALDISTTVTLDAQGTQEYPIPQGFTGAKVMLWNITSQATTPLADAIQLN